MQSTSLCPSSFPFGPVFSRSSTDRTKKAVTVKKPNARVVASKRGEEERRDQYSGGRLVDREMIVLRKRIHEMKTAEGSHEPPPQWMGWEKSCYASYDSTICEAVGFLQSRMMDARPGVVLGLATLVVLSVPTASALVLFRLAEMAGEILATFHLSAW